MKIHLSAHAVDRYIERVKYGFERDGAEREIRALIELAGEPQPTAPEWVPKPDSDAWLELAPGICLALAREAKRWVAVTTLTRAGQGDDLRARRNEKKRQRRARRKRATWDEKRGRASHRRKARLRAEEYG